MIKYAFRDFFRRRRIARHVATHGHHYDYHGTTVTVPERAGLGVRYVLMRGRYEVDEAAMILQHLPKGLPVIELGGSLGVISALFRSRIGRTAQHIVVEANPDLVDICAANAALNADAGATDVVNAAVYYDAPSARFRVSDNAHQNALDDGSGKGRTIEIPAVTLSALYDRIGSPKAFALVSDIEGAEYAVFEAETDILANIAVAIGELHPAEFERSGKSANHLKLSARKQDFA